MLEDTLNRGARLQVGFAHFEIDGTWIDATFLVQGALWSFTYRSDAQHRQRVVYQPLTALQDEVRPRLLIPTPVEFASPEHAYDEKEYLFVLELDGDGIVPVRRKDASLLLRPLDAAGVPLVRNRLVLLSGEIDRMLMDNPEALRQYLHSRTPQARARRRVAAGLSLCGFVGLILTMIAGNAFAQITVALGTLLSTLLLLIAIGVWVWADR